MDKRLHPDTFIRLYRSVVSNENSRMGQPIIAGTVWLAIGIARLAERESLEEVARVYRITIDNVKDAIWYYKKIKNPIRDKEMFRKFTSNVSD